MKEDGDERASPLLAIGQVLWGVILLASILAYSVYATVLKSPDPEPRRAETTPARSSASTSALALAFPGGTRTTPMFHLYIMCDGETVASAIYDGPIYNDFVALLATPDHSVILALLQGQPTIFPADATVYQSVCFRRLLESGTFV